MAPEIARHSAGCQPADSAHVPDQSVDEEPLSELPLSDPPLSQPLSEVDPLSVSAPPPDLSPPWPVASEPRTADPMAAPAATPAAVATMGPDREDDPPVAPYEDDDRSGQFVSVSVRS
ncbi:hypothetical protein [Reyranella sp. CPCC 100927]|uniref:hypothetical protein n=1 Tax=Reyranella sp. CPCC 100927 TaxID=2599616 RepID=UPI0011B69E59|nr:hypothetical protein [Reyranella sp. CPCC 100927]TWT05818.1 hypothetical protein FQU96_25300 [Reyranella sp. CPCC 100927]